ncbi:MAG: lamin tail domain-containing protein, partial [Planctomycetota bacterium]|nr:lamin tail domain-containing protein [Planctomycetota bacterium]
MGKKNKSQSILTVSLACLALAVGCGGGGGGSGATFTPPATTISGQATAGPVSGGMAEVYSIDPNSRGLSLVGSSTTNAQGQFSVSLQGSGPFLVLVRGGSYIDEATGGTRNLGTPAQPTSLDSPRGNTLEGVVGANVNGSITINLSPLTTMASRRLAQISQSNPGIFDPGAVAGVNSAVAQEFGLGAVDPSGLIPVDFTDAANASFIAANPNDANVLLGAVLSGLSQLAVDLGVVDPMDVVEALAQDFSDGIFNGAMGSALANQGLGVVFGNAGLAQNTATTLLSNSTTNFLNNNGNNNSGTNAAANNGVITALGTLDVTPGGNTAPFFDGIADQLLNLNLGTTNLSVTTVSPGAPASESTQTVTLMATSSDTAILPNPVITGTGATRNLALSPSALGTATVTISVMDDGGTANGGVNIFARTFVVSVFAPNQAPSFTMIQDRVMNEDTTGSLSVTNITATEATQTITSVTATSSNTAVLPNPTITGSGATRTLTLTPVADAFGTTMVTVTVVDDGGTANGGIDTFSQSFMVTVTSVNDQPTFDAIPNQSVAQGSTMTQMVTISNVSAGPANETQTLTFTAVSGNTANFANPTITGSGTTRTLSFTPNANATGTTTITVTAMDNDGGNDTLQRTFTIMVVAPAGLAQVSTVVPPLASSAGGTNVRVATSMFMEDFTVTAPTANVGGMSALVSVVNATTIDVTVPTGLTTGTTSIQVTTPTDVATFSTFNIVAPVTANEVIINEILFDPSGSDSNNDGMPTSNQDEYVEFVNTRTTPVDITGFQMTEGAGTRHVFTNPTTIPAGGCIILFGGGTPTGFAAAHGNGAAQIALTPNSGGLGLNNSGDTVTLLDPSGQTTINAVTFGQSTSPAESINRNPDADPTAPFVLHSMVPGAQPLPSLARFSPAVKVDQTPHGPAAPMASIDTVVPGLADLAGGTNIAVTTSNFGDFTVNAPNVTVGGSIATIMNVTANAFVLQVPPGLTAGNVTISVMNANGTATFTTFQIVASVTVGDVFINELLADPGNPATILDANGDGTGDTDDDEFVELVNN